MLINKSEKTIEAWWDGNKKEIRPGEKFDVRDLNVIASLIPAVEDRMLKKHPGLAVYLNGEQSSAPTVKTPEKAPEEGSHEAGVREAIAEGEKKLADLKLKTDAKSKKEALKIEKQLEALRERLK